MTTFFHCPDEWAGARDLDVPQTFQPQKGDLVQFAFLDKHSAHYVVTGRQHFIEHKAVEVEGEKTHQIDHNLHVFLHPVHTES